jgi:hypothetical protein
MTLDPAESFAGRLRFVLQSHEREVKARDALFDAERELHAAKASRLASPYLEKKVATCRDALAACNQTLDEAIEQFEHRLPVAKSRRTKP